MLTNKQVYNKLKARLLENPDVQLWLKNFKPEPPFKWNLIHGSFDWQFENSIAKIMVLHSYSFFLA